MLWLLTNYLQTILHPVVCVHLAEPENHWKLSGALELSQRIDLECYETLSLLDKVLDGSGFLGSGHKMLCTVERKVIGG